MSKEQTPIEELNDKIVKAKIVNKAIDIIFKKGSKTSLKADLIKALDYAMESYANEKLKNYLPKDKVKELIEKHSEFIDANIDHEGIMNACCNISPAEWDDDKWIEENL